MDSASIQFVLFGLGMALVSNLSRSRVWRSLVLLIASLVFLGFLERDPILFLPLFVFLLLGYIGIFAIQQGWSRSAIQGNFDSHFRVCVAEEIYLSTKWNFSAPIRI